MLAIPLCAAASRKASRIGQCRRCCSTRHSPPSLWNSELPAKWFSLCLNSGSTSFQAQPVLEYGDLNLAVGVADELGDPKADHVLEAGDVGCEIGVKVVALESGPEAVVLCALELSVERAQLGDGLGQLRSRGWAGVLVRRREEVHGEVELGGRELCHGLDEDVGDDLVLDPVGVELVSNPRGEFEGGSSVSKERPW